MMQLFFMPKKPAYMYIHIIQVQRDCNDCSKFDIMNPITNHL